jgi:hypothetical protein
LGSFFLKLQGKEELKKWVEDSCRGRARERQEELGKSWDVGWLEEYRGFEITFEDYFEIKCPSIGSEGYHPFASPIHL